MKKHTEIIFIRPKSVHSFKFFKFFQKNKIEKKIIKIEFKIFFVIFFSGEYAFRTIADYLSWAKRPMISRIDKLDNKIPMWFVFGGKSWIDFTSGFDARNKRPDSILTSVKVS